MKSFCLLLLFVFLSFSASATAHIEEAAALNLQLGLEYLKRNDYPRAKTKFLKALSLMPHCADTNSAIAYYFEKTGDLKAANKYYYKALSLAPNSGSQLNNYGTYLCRMGRYKESDMYFRKAVNDIHYLNTGAAYENAGLCAAEIPDYPRALGYFKKALEHDPHRRQSLYELTSIKIKQNRSIDALNDLQNYQDLVFSDPLLLGLAIKAAEKANNHTLETQYRMRLGITGENNEHNNKG